MVLRRYLPGLTRIGGYSGEQAVADLIAGLILSVLLVPQAMAYAMLAGLPPQVGLYAAVAPPLVYALLGTSSYVSMGPVALASLLVADALGRASVPALEGAAIIAVETGALLLLLGLLRLGRLVNFVSDPALLGFTAAVAVLIAASQLPSLLGIDTERAGTILGTIGGLFPRLGELNPAAFALGGAALVLLLLADRYAPALLWKAGLHPPWRTAAAKSIPLLVLVAAAAAAAVFALDIDTVERPPGGLPPLGLPPFTPQVWLELLPASGIIAIIIFVTGSAVAKSLAGRRRQALDTSQEAIAIGAANIAAGFTGGYAPGVSLSRSALVYDSGGRTPFASAVAALVVLFVAFFLPGPLSYLPETALAALVITAVFGLVKLRAIRATFRHSKTEGGIFAATLIATLIFGVQWGLAAGAALGIAGFLWFSSLPRVTRLGYQPEADHYRSVDREDVEVDSLPVLVLRIDHSLYFGNVGHCEDELLKLISRHPDARALLIDMKGVNAIDASGMAMLERLVDNLEEKDLRVGFAVVRQPLKPHFRRSYKLRSCDLFEDVEAGVEEMKRACEAETGKAEDGEAKAGESPGSGKVATY